MRMINVESILSSYLLFAHQSSVFFLSRGKTGIIKHRVVTQTSVPILMDHEFRKQWSKMRQFAGILRRFWYCLFLAVNVVYDFGLCTGRFMHHWRKNRTLACF